MMKVQKEIANCAIIECLSFLTQFAIAFIASLVALFAVCAQRVPSTRERSKRRKGSSSRREQSVEVDAPPVVELKSKRSDTSQRSVKSERRDAMDSIKIIRGQKNVRKARPMTGKPTEETDSQHTETINVPLGKANTAPPASKLTVAAQQKTDEKREKNERKVQFADKLVKSTISPTVETQRSTKSAKSLSKKKKSQKLTRSEKKKGK
ncbi:unnamed protein product [Caenorhabditis sp. 36 PRJEB53466]|nr:unnamed protein product [Caenorhabditis sp. 36 PRJEB53466]